jgi:hypothetical protein
MSKYEKLGSHLREQGGSRVVLSFEQIEDIQQFRLPDSARRHRAWWTNVLDGTHTQAVAWMNAGWRVSRADLAAEWVEFEPMSSEAMLTAMRRNAGALRLVDPVTFDRSMLSHSARRTLDHYTQRFDGNVQKAIDHALSDALSADRMRQWEALRPATATRTETVDTTGEALIQP